VLRFPLALRVWVGALPATALLISHPFRVRFPLPALVIAGLFAVVLYVRPVFGAVLGPDLLGIQPTLAPLQESYTRPADAPTTFEAQIDAAQRMAAWTATFAGIDRCDCMPAQHVDPRRDWLHVVGIQAATLSAEVVNVQGWRDRTDEQFVGDPMRQARMSVDADADVASVGIVAPRPYPARTGAVMIAHQVKSSQERHRGKIPTHGKWAFCHAFSLPNIHTGNKV